MYDAQAASGKSVGMLGLYPYSRILRISDEKTLQLLNLYRQEECLWNKNHKHYKNQMYRRRASKKIAAVLDIPNFGPGHVMIKFKNLRNAYSQELKKLARSEAVGDTYRPTVFWFKKMGFIRPHLQRSHNFLTSDSGATTDAHSSLVYRVEGTEEWLQDNPPTPEYVATAAEVVKTNENGEKSQRKLQRNTCNASSIILQKLDSDSDEQPVETTSSQTEKTNDNTIQFEKFLKDFIAEQQKIVKDLSSSVRTLSSRDDDVFENFGKYVAGLLRTLPDKKALEVQPQIVSLITAAGLRDVEEKEKVQSNELLIVKEEK